MAIDYNIFDKLKTKQDYDRANEEFQMRKKLANAQIAKANEVDVDQMGEQAFLKAAQGIPLSPQEYAAARVFDAKSGGIMINPATGAFHNKPRLSDKIGLDVPQGMEPIQPAPQGSNQPPALPPAFGGVTPAPMDEFEIRYQEQLKAAAGNPKLQQSIRQKYSDERMQYDEAQSKAAGFSDRLHQANPVFDDPSVVKEGMSAVQRTLGAIPLVGNYAVSDKYQKFDQAKRNFVNAVLRRESGAVISDEEFDNADKQYFPQPGDSAAVLEQKKVNRAEVINGMQRSAGAAYAPPSQPEPQGAPKPGMVKGGYVFLGGDPSKQSSWKPVK